MNFEPDPRINPKKIQKPRMRRITSVAVETIERPDAYTRAQIQMAVRIAHALHRGRFILTEPPPPR